MEDQARFNKYVLKAREHATNGEIEEAIKYNKKAYHIAQVDKIANRIKKLEVKKFCKPALILYCKCLNVMNISYVRQFLKSEAICFKH